MRSHASRAMVLGAVAGVAVAVAGLCHPLRLRTHPRHHHGQRTEPFLRARPGAVTAARLVARTVDGGVSMPTSGDGGAGGATAGETEREGPRTPAARAEAARACHDLGEPDGRYHWISRDDLGPTLGPVHGDDLLALVNRSPRFALDPGWAPTDLVDLATGQPATAAQCVPPVTQCLRREAAGALGRMLAAMAAAGMPGYVHSGFRSFRVQCGVFRKWAYVQGEGFCGAAMSSALAGHSQHQLGTALDLFTEAWARDRVAMRAGFGCTPGGQWLAAHGWEYGYVLPYPLPVDGRVAGSVCALQDEAGDGVDPRTGYRYEPWHVRYIGTQSAARFHAAVIASGPGTGGEITLEQWLRRARGIDGDADLPVCDGCTCGLCASFHEPSRGGHAARGPCADEALVLGANGEPVAASAPPRLTAARAVAVPEGVRVEVTVTVPLRTVTQTPAVTAEGPRYVPGARPWTLSMVHGGPSRSYPDLRGAWRLAVAPSTDESQWPWRAALRDDAAATRMDAANILLPALAGTRRVVLVVPSAERLRVALIRDGVPSDVTVVPVVRESHAAERDLTVLDPRGR